MSFLSLFNNIPANGRIKIEGGQTQGAVARTKENLSVKRYTPTLGKGSEYAAKIKEEEDNAYYEVNYGSVHKHTYVRIRNIIRGALNCQSVKLRKVLIIQSSMIEVTNVKYKIITRKNLK